MMSLLFDENMGKKLGHLAFMPLLKSFLGKPPGRNNVRERLPFIAPRDLDLSLFQNAILSKLIELFNDLPRVKAIAFPAKGLHNRVQ